MSELPQIFPVNGEPEFKLIELPELPVDFSLFPNETTFMQTFRTQKHGRIDSEEIFVINLKSKRKSSESSSKEIICLNSNRSIETNHDSQQQILFESKLNDFAVL